MIRESTKHQPYTYSLKTAAFASVAGGGGASLDTGNICTNAILFYLVPPDGALSIENLYCHLIMEFDASVASQYRILRKIGIVDEDRHPVFHGAPNRMKLFDVNWQADSNGKIDKRIDLSALLKKDDVTYRDYFMPIDAPETGYTYIYLEFDETQLNNAQLGRIVLWKADALYTTVGIV